MRDSEKFYTWKRDVPPKTERLIKVRQGVSKAGRRDIAVEIGTVPPKAGRLTRMVLLHSRVCFVLILLSIDSASTRFCFDSILLRVDSASTQFYFASIRFYIGYVSIKVGVVEIWLGAYALL